MKNYDVIDTNRYQYIAIHIYLKNMKSRVANTSGNKMVDEKKTI